jgi:hypothetical protein
MTFPLVVISAAAAAMLYGCGGPAQSQTPPAQPAPAQPSLIQPDSLPEDFEVQVVDKDVPYVPTAQETVEEMLRMVKVSRNDVVFDLGSGDGRIVITAARKYGARGVGIDIDPERIREANENARAAGVTDRVRFIKGDLFEADLRDATKVTLYLLRSVNIRLRPKLLAELKPGTPIVSHDFDMGEWEPDDQKSVEGDQLYLWIVPARVDGTWSWTTPGGQRRVAVLRQKFQKVEGRVEAGEGNLGVRNGKMNGEEIAFELTRGGTSDAPVVERYRGRVSGRDINGTAEAGEQRWTWRASMTSPAAP